MRYSLRTLFIVTTLVGARVGLAVRVVQHIQQGLQRTIEMTHESVKARQENEARLEAEKIIADHEFLDSLKRLAPQTTPKDMRDLSD